MKSKSIRYCLVLIGLMVTAVPGYTDDVVEDPAGQAFRLIRAVMCETIEGYEPKHMGVVFSVSAGRISFYTAFDGVTETTFIEHKWYRRDELITIKRLTLRPPSWATYSSIQLREADKGPWRVEIWDARDQLTQTLRFSVTE
jgi:hypothetical protein